MVQLIRMGNSIRLKWVKICSKEDSYIRPNKKISVFRLTGLKILGRVGSHIFFQEKNYFMHFERQNAFQNP